MLDKYILKAIPTQFRKCCTKSSGAAFYPSPPRVASFKPKIITRKLYSFKHCLAH